MFTGDFSNREQVMNLFTIHSTTVCRSVLATLALTGAGMANAAEPLVVQLHWLDVYGVRALQSGDYQKGVERLERRLEAYERPARLRAPILIDLCAGYIVLERFDEAARACDEAIATQAYTGLALNNRGVLNTLTGRHAAAIEDLTAATTGELGETARMNLDRVRERVARVDAPPPSESAVTIAAR
jgi:Flp pilus assembly protein TadD